MHPLAGVSVRDNTVKQKMLPLNTWRRLVTVSTASFEGNTLLQVGCVCSVLLPQQICEVGKRGLGRPENTGTGHYEEEGGRVEGNIQKETYT